MKKIIIYSVITILNFTLFFNYGKANLKEDWLFVLCLIAVMFFCWIDGYLNKE
jgi:hypothetical protein